MRRKKAIIRVLLSLVLLVIVVIAGDGLIKHRPYFPAIYWRSLDPLVHGLIGVIVLSPLARSWKDLIPFFLASTIIDLDHIIAANSFNVADMLDLPLRPWTHSITFGILAASVSYLLTRNLMVFSIILIAMISHVVRDASTGITPLLYPLEINSIPYTFYVIVEIALYFVSLALSKSGLHNLQSSPMSKASEM